MRGVKTMASSGEPPPDSPAPPSTVRIAWTPDQLEVVGPPGTAHSLITARAPSIDPDCIAVWSMAASWASAPSGVCGNPVGTPAGPTSVAGGSTIGGPGSRSETGPGRDADKGTAGIGWAANVASGPPAGPPA